MMNGFPPSALLCKRERALVKPKNYNSLEEFHLITHRNLNSYSNIIQLSGVHLMKKKTIKTPSVGLTLILSLCAKCYDSVFKSMLLRQSHTTRHNHCRGSIPQKEKQRKPFLSLHSRINCMCSLYFWFFLAEKESLKGITVFVGRQAGCLHTSRITTNGVNTLTRVSFSARGFQGFCSKSTTET